MELFDRGTEENLSKVDGCFVVWKDLNRLKKYTNLKRMSGRELDRWLVSEFSFVSRPHLRKNDVNQRAQTNGQERLVYRPHHYGRAAIFRTKHGYFDVKGIGVAPDKEPILDSYGTGLINVVDAASEVIRESHVATAVSGKIACVRTLAIIVYPFCMADPQGSQMMVPCAIMVREFFLRPSWVEQVYFSGSDICTAMIESEIMLREQGFTSCHPARDILAKEECGTVFVKCGHENRFQQIFSVVEHLAKENFISLPAHFEVPNIEFAMDFRGRIPGLLMIDFGSIRTRQKFEKDVLAWVVGKGTAFSFLRRKDADFVKFATHTCKHSPFYSDAGCGRVEVFGTTLDKECATRGFFDLAMAASSHQNKRLMQTSLAKAIGYWTK